MRQGSISVLLDHYGTYLDERTGRRESHIGRISSQVAVAIAFAVFVQRLSDDNISVLVTALSILIGFAFSALFPIASDSMSGLPVPKFSEDHDDLAVIRKLSKYFRYNVGYFILISLLCIGLLLLQMVHFSLPDWLSSHVSAYIRIHKNLADTVSALAIAIPKASLIVTVFLVMEVSYTFYRMCFNALAILRVKDNYKSSRLPSDHP